MADLPYQRRFWRQRPRLTRAVLLLSVFGIAFFGGLAYASWTLVCRGGQCPTIAVLEDFTPHQTSKLYAADGRFIAEIGLERRTLVKLSDIPRPVRDSRRMQGPPGRAGSGSRHDRYNARASDWSRPCARGRPLG